jgi:hypothetical protein
MNILRFNNFPTSISRFFIRKLDFFFFFYGFIARADELEVLGKKKKEKVRTQFILFFPHLILKAREPFYHYLDCCRESGIESG